MRPFVLSDPQGSCESLVGRTDKNTRGAFLNAYKYYSLFHVYPAFSNFSFELAPVLANPGPARRHPGICGIVEGEAPLANLMCTDFKRV